MKPNIDSDEIKKKTQPKDCHQGLHRSDVLVPCSVKDESCGRCQGSHVFF